MNELFSQLSVETKFKISENLCSEAYDCYKSGKEGGIDEAISIYNICLALGYNKALFEMGEMYEALENEEMAVRCYKQAMFFDKVDAARRLAIIYYFSDNYVDAEHNWKIYWHNLHEINENTVDSLWFYFSTHLDSDNTDIICYPIMFFIPPKSISEYFKKDIDRWSSDSEMLELIKYKQYRLIEWLKSKC